MLKLIPRAHKEQLSTAVCRSNHKVFPLAEADGDAQKTNDKVQFDGSLLSVWMTGRVKSGGGLPASEAGGFQNSRTKFVILPKM